MMKQLLPLVVFLIFSSCIPIRIAPSIRTEKLMLAKKFQKKLPKEYALIFEDPKDAGEFYYFINSKYNVYEENDQWKVPISINNETFFLSFYEVEKSTKTINFVPILFDGFLGSKGIDPLFQNFEYSRTGHWFLALTVSDLHDTDCLNPNYQYHKEVVNYLRALKSDYLNAV